MFSRLQESSQLLPNVLTLRGWSQPRLFSSFKCTLILFSPCFPSMYNRLLLFYRLRVGIGVACLFMVGLFGRSLALSLSSAWCGSPLPERSRMMGCNEIRFVLNCSSFSLLLSYPLIRQQTTSHAAAAPW